MQLAVAKALALRGAPEMERVLKLLEPSFDFLAKLIRIGMWMRPETFRTPWRFNSGLRNSLRVNALMRRKACNMFGRNHHLYRLAGSWALLKQDMFQLRSFFTQLQDSRSRR